MGTHHKSDREARKRKATRQFDITAKNRVRKFLKHLKRHPNDTTKPKNYEVPNI